MWYAASVVLRLLAAAFFLLTWGYGIATYSPFAFEMFIRPQLMPWLAKFVVWHHLWYWGAFLGSAITVIPDLTGSNSVNDGRRETTRWLAVAYVVVFGLVGVWLVMNPYIPTLWNDSRSLMVALVSLTPLLWLAVIDHLAAPTPGRALADAAAVLMGQRRLLVACTSTAFYLWLVHLVHAVWRAHSTTGALGWMATSAWALALASTTFLIVYVVFSLVTAIACATRRPGAWEHVLTVGLVAAAIGEFLRRIVLPAISFDSRDAVTVSVSAGAILAATWSGLARRRPMWGDAPSATSLDALLVPRPHRTATIAVALVVLPVVTFVMLDRIERLDWNFVLQKALVVGEWTLAFGLFLRLCDRIHERRWSARLLLAPPLVALVLLFGIPTISAFLAERTGDERLDPEVELDRYASVDPSFRLAASGLIEQPGLDLKYYRYLLGATATSGAGSTPHDVEFSARLGPPGASRPHIFMFVIDSLRRDYLSPYNRAVTFTPGIDEFAADSFVFRNAFTWYGGTWLAMPSIWVGGQVTRRWGTTGFDRLNAIEKLIAADGYRLVINDHTVAQYLRLSTPVVPLDPDVPSVATDLCHLVGSLEAHLDRTAADARPVFAYLAPMNVHILNTRSDADAASASEYPGFYAPYASRLKRLDVCFGSFVAGLKRRGLYDDSVIVVTADHGDSLGEEGHWGHQFFLFPEDVRLPLIVHLPRELRAKMTTDLGRVAFSADIAPTLYALLGHSVRELGPLFGTPMFVSPDTQPTPRRRASYLLMSSYGPTYGLLRRNGRFMYVSDLMNWREFAFDLSAEPLGTRVELSDDLRRVNQQQILQHVGEAGTPRTK